MEEYQRLYCTLASGSSGKKDVAGYIGYDLNFDYQGLTGLLDPLGMGRGTFIIKLGATTSFDDRPGLEPFAIHPIPAQDEVFVRFNPMALPRSPNIKYSMRLVRVFIQDRDQCQIQRVSTFLLGLVGSIISKYRKLHSPL